MRTATVEIAEDGQDLINLPVGSSILTAQRQIMDLDQIEPESGRADAGVKYWIEPGTLTPYPLPGLDWWFPAIILKEEQ